MEVHCNSKTERFRCFREWGWFRNEHYAWKLHTFYTSCLASWIVSLLRFIVYCIIWFKKTKRRNTCFSLFILIIFKMKKKKKNPTLFLPCLLCHKIKINKVNKHKARTKTNTKLKHNFFFCQCPQADCWGNPGIKCEQVVSFCAAIHQFSFYFTLHKMIDLYFRKQKSGLLI